MFEPTPLQLATRRQWLAAFALSATGLALSACGLQPASQSPGAPSGAGAQPTMAPIPTAAPAATSTEAKAAPTAAPAGKAKPKELNIAGWSQPDGHATQLLARYSEETGIAANYLEMPAKYTDLVTKYTNYLQSGYDGIDVYLLDDMTVGQFAAAGWIIDMKPFMTQQEIEAWLPAVQQMFQFTGGVHRLPVFFGSGAFYYRKDILDQEKLAAPATWEELVDTGKKLKAKYPDMWPWAPMADTGNQDVNHTIQTIWQGGGDPKVMNDEGSVKALQHLHDLLFTDEITPSSITTYGTQETRALAKEGKQLMWWDFEGGLAIYDQADSPIKGKVGLAPWPAGPGGSWGMAHAWGWGVPQFTKHTEAAVEFAKWATAPRQLKDFMVGVRGITPPKTELANDPEVQAKLPFTRHLIETAGQVRFRLIDVPNPLEVQDVIGKTGSFVVTGQKSVQEAAAWGNGEMQKALRKR
jgi:ABC-type glycerol-3-phosphate transport system substrate-binding protein